MVQSFLEYLKYEKRASPHTILAYQNDLSQFESFAQKEFQSKDFGIEKSDYSLIRSWVIHLMEIEKPKKLDEKTINRKLASLRAFFKFLKLRGKLETIPTQKTIPLKTAKKLPQFIKNNEAEYLLKPELFANQKYGERDKLILELLYGTGIRLSELINLKISDINFQQSTISVLGKRKKQRLIPLHDSLINQIQHYIKNEGLQSFLITTPKGTKAYPVMIQRIVKKYLSLTSNVGQKSPHTLRHTFATHLLNEGAELNAIKELLGHSNLSATQIYTHNSLERLKKVFEKAHPKGSTT